MLKQTIFDDGCSVVGTAEELSTYMKDVIYDEMFKIPSLGWGFMEDGDFLAYLQIATELDEIWMSGDTDVYTLVMLVGARYDIYKGEGERDESINV